MTDIFVSIHEFTLKNCLLLYFNFDGYRSSLTCFRAPAISFFKTNLQHSYSYLKKKNLKKKKIESCCHVFNVNASIITNNSKNFSFWSVCYANKIQKKLKKINLINVFFYWFKKTHLFNYFWFLNIFSFFMNLNKIFNKKLVPISNQCLTRLTGNYDFLSKRDSFLKTNQFLI